jgi:hypothetical protein
VPDHRRGRSVPGASAWLIQKHPAANAVTGSAATGGTAHVPYVGAYEVVTRAPRLRPTSGSQC